jgi:hypothetical protein
MFVGVVLVAVTGCADPEKEMSGLSKQESQQITQIVEAYIAKEKKWPRQDYSIEWTKTKTECGYYIVNVVHKDDLQPGDDAQVAEQKSVELYVDLVKQRIDKEFHFQ